MWQSTMNRWHQALRDSRWIAGSHTVEHPLAVPVNAMSDSLSHLPPLTLASQLDSIYNEEFSMAQYG